MLTAIFWYNSSVKNNNNTNDYYTSRQLKLLLEIEKMIDIADPVYSFCDIMDRIDLKKFLATEPLYLGLVTLTALMVDTIFTKNLDNIMANRIEFVSSVLIGTLFFVIRTLFSMDTKQLMVSIMSIVVSFFIMSFYVTVRMIVFSKVKSVSKGRKKNYSK